MNPEQVLRALYEGSIIPNDIALSFSALNCKEDADSKKPYLLSLLGEAESVATVCNSLTIEQELTNPITDPSTQNGELK